MPAKPNRGIVFHSSTSMARNDRSPCRRSPKPVRASKALSTNERFSDGDETLLSQTTMVRFGLQVIYSRLSLRESNASFAERKSNQKIVSGFDASRSVALYIGSWIGTRQRCQWLVPYRWSTKYYFVPPLFCLINFQSSER